MYVEIFERIKKDIFKLQKLVKKLKLENDNILKDRFQTLDNFFNGNYITFGSKKFDGPQAEFMDILRRLDNLGYKKEIEPYTIVYSSYDLTPKDAYAFEDRMKDEIKQALETHNEFQEAILGKEVTKTKVKEVDIRNYAKFILRKKPIEKKRELLDTLIESVFLLLM